MFASSLELLNQMRSARKRNQDKIGIIHSAQANFATPTRAITNVATEYNLHSCFFFYVIDHIIFHVSFRGMHNINRIEALYFDMENREGWERESKIETKL